MSKTILLLFSLSALCHAGGISTGTCQFWYGDAWYNMLTTESTNQVWQASNADETVYFSWCSRFDHVDTQSTCDGTWYAAVEDGAGTCSRLSSEISTSIGQGSAKNAAGEDVLAMVYTSDDCTLTVAQICDKAVWPPVQGALTKSGTCTYSTTQTSKAGCEVYSLNALQELLGDLQWLWGAIAIVLGAILAFFGRKMFHFTILTVGTLASTIAFLILFRVIFMTDTTPEWAVWIVLVVATAMGSGVGYLLSRDRCQATAAAFLSGFGGFLLGSALCLTFQLNSAAAYWSISIALAAGGAVAAFYVFKPLIVIVTSFAGSYMFVRGISLYAGGFPSEIGVWEQMESGAYEFEDTFYIYLGCIVCITIGSMMYQCRVLKSEEVVDEFGFTDAKVYETQTKVN